jgi:hypothetical protein
MYLDVKKKSLRILTILCPSSNLREWLNVGRRDIKKFSAIYEILK